MVLIPLAMTSQRSALIDRRHREENRIVGLPPGLWRNLELTAEEDSRLSPRSASSEAHSRGAAGPFRMAASRLRTC